MRRLTFDPIREKIAVFYGNIKRRVFDNWIRPIEGPHTTSIVSPIL